MALLWGRRPLRELPNDEENPVNEKPSPKFHLKRLSKSSAPVFEIAGACVEINQCVGCTRQFFTKPFLGDDAAVLARSSGEEPASPRHRSSRRRVDGVEVDAERAGTF